MTKIPRLSGEYLKFNQHQIYHYFAGKGIPLIFIHGGRSDALRFEAIIRYLAGHFQVYAPDLPGFGKSPPLPGRQTLTAYAQVIREYLKYLNLKDFLLVGGSMGGIIVIEALKPNDLPVRIVGLMATPYDKSVISLPPVKLALLKVFLKSLYYSKIGLWGLQKIIDSDPVMEPLIRRAQPPKFRRSEIVKFEVRQWRVMSMKVWTETILDTLNVNFAQESFKINAPAVVLYPAKDHYIDNEKNLKGLAKIFKEIRPVELPLDRHVPPGRMSYQEVKALSDPLINQLIIEFGRKIKMD